MFKLCGWLESLKTTSKVSWLKQHYKGLSIYACTENIRKQGAALNYNNCIIIFIFLRRWEQEQSLLHFELLC